VQTVEEIHLDVTSHCNAKCPGCARNNNGGETVSWLKLHHLDLKFWDNFLTDIKNKFQIKKILFNGNYGEPIMHPNLIDIIKIFKKNYPESVIRISTNGSSRSSEWWQELASVLNDSDFFHNVQFAVDGLEDTHSIYRRNTDFNKVIKNMKTFIEAGGIAQMFTILFAHNQHQINELIDMARSLGCAGILLRPSRYGQTEVNAKDQNFTIYAEKNRKIPENAEWFAPPTPDAVLPGPVSDKIIWFDDNNSYVKASQKKFITNSINKSKCPWLKRSIIQMDCWGNIWPCCHIAETETRNGHPDIDKSITRINSLYKRSLDNIMTDPWFTKTLPESLDSNPWDICQKRCGIV